MTKNQTEPQITRSIRFPYSIYLAGENLTNKEGGSVNQHVIEGYKQYLKTKGYLK